MVILFLLFLVGCTTPPPIVIEEPIPIEKEVPLDSIRNLAGESFCAKRSWKDRGVASRGYFEGMALVYARAVCKGGSIPLGSSSVDALAHYGLKPEDLLTSTYTFLIGLGLRESTGRHCCGRDGAATNVSGESAEAGLFQTSYDSRIRGGKQDPTLMGIYEKYKASNKGCLLDVFAQKVTCSAANWKNWGTGEGVTFQKLSKDCPAFAAEYAAVMIRTGRSHYGPINKKEVEYRGECESMLFSVKKMIAQNPDLCGSL